MPGGTSGLVTWTAAGGLPLAGTRPHTVELSWSWAKTSGSWNENNCTDKNGNPCKASGTFGPVQRAFLAGDRSGPPQRPGLRERRLHLGSNSFQTGTTHTLGTSPSPGA